MQSDRFGPALPAAWRSLSHSWVTFFTTLWVPKPNQETDNIADDNDNNHKKKNSRTDNSIAHTFQHA